MNMNLSHCLLSETYRYLRTATPLNDFDENILTETSETNFASSHKLNIIDVKLSDEGNFTCHTVQTATDNNTPQEISFFIQPIITARIVGHNSPIVKVKTSQSVILYCLIEAYPIDMFIRNITWQKYDSTVTLDNKKKIIPLNETHINATLEMYDVSKKDNGTYICTIPSTTPEEFTRLGISLLVLDFPHVSIDYVKSVGANKIYLNWTVNDGNDPVQKYFIQYMEEGNPTFTYYNHEIEGRNTSYVLENFSPNTKYQLKMSAKNSIGNGPQYTYHQWIRTLEKNPIFVPKVEVTGSTSSTMTINWSPPPPDLLDFVHYYELVVSEAGENSNIIEEAIHPQNNRNLPYMFDNLKTATDYEIKVRACSDWTKECGPWSEIVNGTTMDGVSSEPTNVRITCSHFNISRRNSVTVMWDKPKTPNGKIIAYLVQLKGVATYRVENSLKNETWGPKIKRIPEEALKATYVDVNPNTNYTANVSAITRNKKSGVAAVASCEMPVTVPDNIGKIMWSKIKTGNDKCIFKLYLPRISERNGPICCYRIYLVRVNEYNRELPLPENLDILTYNEVHSVNNTKGGAYLAEMFPGGEYHSEIFLGDGKRMFGDRESQLRADEICRQCLEGTPFRRTIKKRIFHTTTTIKPEGINRNLVK